MRVVHFTEAYQEDIPKIIKPDKAANYIRAYLSRQPNSHQTIFGVERMLWDAGVPYYQVQHQSSMAMNTIAQRLEQGDFFLLDSRENAFDGIQFFGDISPFVSPLFRNRIKRLAAQTKGGNKEEADSIADIALNTAYFIGGVTKFVGDTVTGTVEAIIEAPTEIAYNALYAVVDTAYYPIDYVARPLGLGLGAVERTVARADSVLSDLTDFAGSVSENWAEGDWQALGSNAAAVLVEASPRALLKPSVADSVKKLDSIVPNKVPDLDAVRLNSRADFRAASRNPQPNTTYEFDGITYTTDNLGRGISSSGQLRLGAGGNRFYDDHLIGHKGVKDDIAFHSGADEFGFQGGPLNLSPGNKKLNIREYRAFERELKDHLQQGKTVNADFQSVFNKGNDTVRPDKYVVKYRVGDGDWQKRIFFNKEGG